MKKKLVKEVKKEDTLQKEVDRKKTQDLADKIRREQLADMLKQQELQEQDLQRKKQLQREQQMRQQREQLASALRQQQILEARARLEREAVNQERSLLNQQNYSATSRNYSANSSNTSNSAASSNTGTSKSGPVTSGSSNLIESQYMASIINRIQQFWSLPEYLQNDASLIAVTVITINQDGQIANVFFENRSSNPIFDQFVSKTLEAANPLPPIPPALSKQRLEVGLRFKPGGIQ
jgi:colicin import membrane protein